MQDIEIIRLYESYIKTYNQEIKELQKEIKVKEKEMNKFRSFVREIKNRDIKQEVH